MTIMCSSGNGSEGAEEPRILQINAGKAAEKPGAEEIHEVGADDHIKRQRHRDDGGHGADAAPMTNPVKHQRCRHDDEVKVGQRRDIHPKSPERQVSIGAEPGVFTGKADEVDVFAVGIGRTRRRQIDGLRPLQRRLQQLRIAKIVGKLHVQLGTGATLREARLAQGGKDSPGRRQSPRCQTAFSSGRR